MSANQPAANENDRKLEMFAQAAKTLESELDAAIDKLKNLTDDDLAALRLKRLEQIKKMEQEKQALLNCNHGRYTELHSDMELFQASKGSRRLVVMFYLDPTERCQVLDRQLAALARRHLECRFCKLNVQKAQFTVTRLRIRFLPTLVSLIDGSTVDFLRASEECCTRDKLELHVLEDYFSRCGAISASDDVAKTPSKELSRLGIRDSRDSDSESD